MLDRLKGRDGLCLIVVVILFALVFHRCEIIKYAKRGIGKAHVIPQLLTLFDSQRRDGLALYYDISLTQKIHIMLMVQGVSVIRDLKIVFLLKGDLLFLKRYPQGFLIYVFVQPRS